MSTTVVAFLCIQVFLVQSIFGQWCGDAYGWNSYGYAPAAWAGPYGESYSPYGSGGAYGYGYGGYDYAGPFAGSLIGDFSSCSATYGGAGVGEVAVAGELPAGGATTVAGQVPILGAVEFAGPVRASGSITIAGTCGCGCAGSYIY